MRKKVVFVVSAFTTERSMIHDDDFEPKLGRIRYTKIASPFLRQVRQIAAVSGGGISRSKPAARRQVFHGNRIGRGSGVGRVLAARDRFAAYRTRRVIVKVRLVKLAGKGIAAARVHLRYLQRDGVTREGLPGDLYDATNDRIEGSPFLDRCDGDRHQFRLIVSAEDGIDMGDLKRFIRRLMEQMEQDLNTKLDWVAVDHFNTGHPHTHIVLRGRDDHGKDLIIAREYLTQGIRERAAELVTIDLGPRSDDQITARLKDEMEQERLTSIDRRLLREAGEDSIVLSGTVREDPFWQTLRAGRLQKLGRLGLAEEIVPGRWRLADDLEPVLRRMGERGDIIKTMNRELAREGLARGTADYAVYDPADAKAGRIVGRVVARGLSDELNDRHYLIVDGVDARTHYIEIGKADATEPTPAGIIVSIAPKQTSVRQVDRKVSEVAAANGGRYSLDIHLEHDPTATATFAETHVRRLEAMRRFGVGVERERDGTWIIVPDHLERAAAYERGLARITPVIITTLSSLPLDRQIGAEGATWLDRELVTVEQTPMRDGGFGGEVREAMARRQRWLIEQDLARQEQDQVIYRANLLGLLRRRELTRAAGQLSDELGLRYAEAHPGERIEGVYRRHIDLASGRFAVIEKSREFTLVPWRPILERNLGKSVSGIARDDDISWSLGRQRSGPSIS
jgi:type IV secretory pathway VirD2 relaxase